MASAPTHAFLKFFKLVLRTIFFPSNWLLSHIIIVETTDSGERGMNPVAMTIINPWKECWLNQGSISDLLFSSPQCYQLSYGSRRKTLEKIKKKCYAEKRTFQYMYTSEPFEANISPILTTYFPIFRQIFPQYQPHISPYLGNYFPHINHRLIK